MIRFRPLFLSVLAVALLVGTALAAESTAPPPSNRPNVLLIITDDK